MSFIKAYNSRANRKAFQEFLNTQGEALQVDGNLGPLTTAAIKRFQVKSGLSADGIVGRDTVNAAIALGFTGFDDNAAETVMNGLDKVSSDRLAKVHPELAKRVVAVIEALMNRGIEVRVVQGLRTYAEQDALYAQGRTKPGKRVTNARGGYSNHNFGLAVDLCPFKDGEPQWDDDAAFNAIGQEAKRQALEWGGDWTKLVDKPHIQLHGLTVAQCRAAYGRGGLKEVWKEIDRLL